MRAVGFAKAAIDDSCTNRSRTMAAQMAIAAATTHAARKERMIFLQGRPRLKHLGRSKFKGLALDADECKAEGPYACIEACRFSMLQIGKETTDPRSDV